ncbi:hypothetical protein AB1Y20_002478 [Prymnesium parvum]|uniref:Ubiquitin-conjugating enzyme E2 Q2 n=1 Tax=Prymnesium parvum TaxID=97485 RepID=A0AB34J930_PRYPA
MGFTTRRVSAAMASAGGHGFGPALQWLLDNEETLDAKEDERDAAVYTQLEAMGFSSAHAHEAVSAVGEELGEAVQWLLDHRHKRPRLLPPARSDFSGPDAPSEQPPLPSEAKREEAPAPRVAPSVAPSARAPLSAKRLMAELRSLAQLEARGAGGCRKAHQFEAAPVHEEDLYTWDVHLYDFEGDGLARDMEARKIERITLRLHFPDQFPTLPPFVHVLRPRLREGTGYVLPGGSICMELLTPSGWSPVTSIIALVMSIRSMLHAGDARLRTTAIDAKEVDYCYAEAQRDFRDIVKTHKAHGWKSAAKFKHS